MRKILLNSFILVTFVLLTDCAQTVHVRPYLTFYKEGNASIPRSVGLCVSDDTLVFVATAKLGVTTVRFPLGESLEPNAKRSLELIFDKVYIVDNVTGSSAKDDSIERTISIAFDEGTGIHTGKTTLHASTMVVNLLCQVYNNQGQLVWEKNVLGKARKGSAKHYFLGGLFGFRVSTDALREIAEECIRQALEKLNRELVAEKTKIFSN